jgi:hypothetical protein
MEIDHESHNGSQNGGEVEAWQKTRAGERIEELKVVEEVCRPLSPARNRG